MKHKAERTLTPQGTPESILLCGDYQLCLGGGDQGVVVNYSPVFVVYYSINDGVHLLGQFGGIWG